MSTVNISGSQNVCASEVGVCFSWCLTCAFRIVLVKVHCKIVWNLHAEERTQGLLLLRQTKRSAQHVQSNSQVDRCILLSCWSKASCASKRDLKSKVARTPSVTHTHTPRKSYLEVRRYQCSETKRWEHFIAGGNRETHDQLKKIFIWAFGLSAKCVCQH